MLTPGKTASRGQMTFSLPLSADSAFKVQEVGNTHSQRHLKQEAAHWGRLLDLMEGRSAFDAQVAEKNRGAKGRPGKALVQRLADLAEDCDSFDKGTPGHKSVKRAVCELLAALPELNESVFDELGSELETTLESGLQNQNLSNALNAAIRHLCRLKKREMVPTGCYWGHPRVLQTARSENSQDKGRSFGLGLLCRAAGCAVDGHSQALRTELKALVGLYAENKMPRESLGMLSIQLLAQCQVISLAEADELPQYIARSVLELLKGFREPLFSQVEREICSMLPEEADVGHQAPSVETSVTAPLFERMPWVLRSVLNGVREGACHWIALLFAAWAIQSAIEAFVDGVGGRAWPPVTILGLTVALAFIGFDQFFQTKIVNRQAFGPPADPQLGRYAKSKCFNLMRWTSLVLPWVLPTSFLLFGLASFDAQARSQENPGFNDTSAFQPEPQGSLLLSNASQCEIAAAMAMSAERIDYAWQCALIPVQAQITGLIARPFRDLLQSGSRSRWTSGLSLCRCIINAEGKQEYIKLTDNEQWKVWLLRDVLYGASSVGTLGVGQAFGKGLILLIQLRACLAHAAIGIEFKSVYGPMNEAFDGFWLDVACKLVAWCPALVGLESPPDQPLVCVVDRQPCIVGDEDGVKKFREHFVRNASARIATAAVGNDAFGSLATLCSRLGYPELEAFFLIVGSMFNAATGGARARTASYLANPDESAHPDTVLRLAEVIVTRGSSASMTPRTPLTPREREIREGLEKRHAIAGAFKSGVSDSSDASGASTPSSAAGEDTSRQEDHAVESSQ